MGPCRSPGALSKDSHVVTSAKGKVLKRANEQVEGKTWLTLHVVHPVRTFGLLARFLLIGCSGISLIRDCRDWMMDP